MTTEQSAALVFTDADDNYYVVWPELVRQARVPTDVATELRDALGGDDTAGFFTPVPIPFEGKTATTSLRLLGAVQLRDFPTLASRLEKVGITPIPIP